MSRPEHLVVVLGTTTGVGKTYVTASLVRWLRTTGVAAVARKPVQSFSVEEDATTDAHVLAEASGEEAAAVCPPHRWYPQAIAPPMAAESLRRPDFAIGDLVNETRWLPGTVLGLVETVGGVRSPAARDGDSLTLAAAFAPERAILVADAGLGCINAIRLALPPLKTLCCPATVVLNRYDGADDLHRRNLAYLRTDGLDPVTNLQSLAATLPHPTGVTFPCPDREK